MEKFLYLTHAEWVEPWVSGGRVPLSLASSYLSTKRHQTLTPDETKIDNSSHDIKDYPFIKHVGKGHSKTVIGNLYIGDALVAQNLHFDTAYEDGLVLCLANRKSNYIAKKLGKIACVRIIDIYELKRILDEQIGSVSQMDCCKYTDSHLRNHFLKSKADEWQDEFRLFWKDAIPQEVTIPKGIAVREKIRCK